MSPDARLGIKKIRLGNVKGYVLADRLYPTKKAVADRGKEILYGAALGAALGPAELPFILDLLRGHEHYEQKVGAGIECITVELNPPYYSRGFWLVRRDGSRTDFSYLHCIRPTPPERLFRLACREAIREQTRQLKQEHFARYADAEGLILCPLADLRIGIDRAHVDHVPPQTFEALVAAFAAAHRLDPAAVEVPHVDGRTGQEFADPDLTSAWQDYHRRHARLRVISDYANLNLVPQEVRRGLGPPDRQAAAAADFFSEISPGAAAGANALPGSPGPDQPPQLDVLPQLLPVVHASQPGPGDLPGRRDETASPGRSRAGGVPPGAGGPVPAAGHDGGAVGGAGGPVAEAGGEAGCALSGAGAAGDPAAPGTEPAPVTAKDGAAAVFGAPESGSVRMRVVDPARWRWLERPGYLPQAMLLSERLHGSALWEQVVRQRDKVSERLTWLAEHEEEANLDQLWEERREATRRSSALFAERLVAVADWAGVTPGDVAGLLLEQEARR